MIPFVNQKPAKVMKIPNFSGGINLSHTDIGDHQLTKCQNMWYKGGVLTTRPALKNTSVDGVFASVKPEVKAENSVVINSKVYVLEKIISGNQLALRYVSNDDKIDLCQMTFQCDSISALPIVYKGDIYVFVSATDTTVLNEIILIKKLSEGIYDVPHAVTKDEIYTPVVLTNGWPCHNDSGKLNAMLKKGATLLEGFNLLSDRYKMKLSQYDATVGGFVEVEQGNINSRVSYMEYGLPYTPANSKGYIYLEYYCVDGQIHRHSVECPRENEPTVEMEGDMINAGDGLYLHAFVKGDVCHVSLNQLSSNQQYEGALIEISKYINNNMTIDAPRPWSVSQMEKVTSMTNAVWYGNTSLGLNGGSRLFMGGSTKEDALVLWSDFENPLYFPESNYAYVGDKSQKITAFGKQGSSLIIFKEKEIYSTQYVQGDILEEEIDKQIDITTRLAYFPMVLIHPTIGCDCPQSIELCRNRLVFASSSGAVYTLTSQSQYSERNVYEISEMVLPELKGENLKDAISADWQGYYMLFIKNRVFIMDYNSYGYVNISSCTKESTATKQIPWFIWHLPQEISAVKAMDNEIMLWTVDGKENFLVKTMNFSDEYSDDDCFNNVSNDFTESKKIQCIMETKHFDFGAPEKNKIIEKVHMEMSKSNSVVGEFISDCNLSDKHDAYFNTLIPYNRCVRFLGVRLSCNGRMSILSLTVKYRESEF